MALGLFFAAAPSPERRGQLDRASDILASGGVHIGGTDFDRQLSLQSVMPLLGYRLLLQTAWKCCPAIISTWPPGTINFAYTRQVQAELQAVRREVMASAIQAGPAGWP